MERKKEKTRQKKTKHSTFMLNVYLARHGQDEDNANGILNGRRDMPLTTLGVNQAKELAEKIKSL